MATLSAAHTAAMAAQRYRLPDGFIPRYTLEEVRAFVGGFPHWSLDRMFRTLSPRLDLHGKRILDLGCGVTLQVLELIEKYYVAEYHGIDPDPDTFWGEHNDYDTYIQSPPHRGGSGRPFWGGHNDYDNYIGYKQAFAFYYPERVTFYNSISEDMPFPDNYFDFAFASQTTEHVQDITAMCAEVRRVLKPDAYFYATHHNFYAWDGHHQGPYFVKDLPHCSPEQMRFQHWRHIDMERDWSEPHHLNRITLRELEAAFRASLRVVTWNTIYTQPERGLDFLTPEILAEFAGRYDYEDLATTTIEVVAKKDHAHTSTRL